MSLEIVRQVGREHPDLLQANLGRTCYQHCVLLVEKLRAAGHDSHLMCKSPGEGQYVPPGFTARTVTGLDGKTYVCSGVSHDAIWCDGKQFDTLGSANEHDRPIYKKSSEPGWSFDPSDGPRIVASPVWDEIPREYWRANNPPFKDGTPTPLPVPTPAPPPAQHEHPGREEMMHAGVWLDGYYRSAEGLQRREGLSKNGVPDWEGVGAWLFEVYFMARVDGKTPEQARGAVIAAIRRTDEWQAKHPGQQP